MIVPTSASAIEICPELTREKIATLNDFDLEWAIFDCAAGKIGHDYNDSYRIIMAQPRVLQVVYITMQLEAEVNNGGFNQYFWNSSGEFADLAPAAFLEINATKNENLAARAVKIAISEIQKMGKYREAGTLEAFSASYKETSLGQLDDEFYKLDENLTALRAAYIRKQFSIAPK